MKSENQKTTPATTAENADRNAKIAMGIAILNTIALAAMAFLNRKKPSDNRQ